MYIYIYIYLHGSYGHSKLTYMVHHGVTRPVRVWPFWSSTRCSSELWFLQSFRIFFGKRSCITMYVLSYLMPADQKMLVSPTASWLQLSGWSTQSSRSEVSEGECLQYCSIPGLMWDDKEVLLWGSPKWEWHDLLLQPPWSFWNLSANR